VEDLVTTDEYRAFCRSELTDPYPLLDELRRRDPVHWSPLLESWVVTSYADATAALRDARLCNDRVALNARALPEEIRPTYTALITHLSNWLGFTDPPKHTRLREVTRKLINPGLAGKARPLIQAHVRRIVSELEESRHVDLMDQLALRLPLTVICELLGIPEEHVVDFHTWASDVSQFAGLVDPSWTPEAQKLVEQANDSWFELEKLFDELVATKRRAGEDDFLTELTAAADAGILSHDELIGLAVFFLAAGHTTTRDLLGNGLYLLVSHPDEAGKIQATEGGVATAVEEILRYESPIPMASRLAGEEFTFGTKTIHPGEPVIVHLAAANRDPAKFERPETFDVLRHHNRQVAFGWAAHSCLGAPLAREQGAVVLEEMLPLMARLELDAPEPAWRSGDMSVRTLIELKASWTVD
jgi:cytochrome P450